MDIKKTELLENLRLLPEWDAQFQVPDVIGYRDYIDNGDAVCGRLSLAWDVYAPDRLEFFPYPNGAKLRWLAVLRPLDLVSLRAAGGRVASATDPALSDRVVSYRLERGGPAWRFRDPRASHGTWRRRASEQVAADAEAAAWRTDVEAYYPSVGHGLVMERLATWGCDLDAATLYMRALATWARTSGLKGLPIGPEVSSAVGNALLVPVDDELIRRGYAHLRYMDDIVVVGRNLAESDLADLVDERLSSLGLRRSVEKTAFYEPGLAAQAVDDALLSYLTRGGRGSTDARLLAEILAAEGEEATPGRSRVNFALRGLSREDSPIGLAALLASPGLMNVDPVTTCSYVGEFGLRLQPVRDHLLAPLGAPATDSTDALQLHSIRAASSAAWGGVEGRMFDSIACDTDRRAPVRCHAWVAASRTPAWSAWRAMEAAAEERHPAVRRAIVLTLRRAPGGRAKTAFARKMLSSDPELDSALKWSAAA